MKIIRLETWVVGDGPEIDPDKGGVEPLAILRIHTDTGHIGLSEVFRVPPGVVQATVGGPSTHFGRMLIGQEITHPERLWQRMYDLMMHTNRRGWQAIILGSLDVAIWDLYGQMLNRPVYELLGGEQRGFFQTHAETRAGYVVPYCTIVSDSWDAPTLLRQQVDRVVRLKELGYRAFKVEPMMSTPETVIEMARLARQAAGPEATLMVDVGYLFNDVPTAARICRRLEEYDVMFFETPFPVDTPEAYHKLAEISAIPLAMGEHGVTRWEFLDMMDRGGVTVVQPYMTTCGGLTEAKRIVDLAVPRGALVCPGNWSTQILGSASVHLAGYSPVTPFIEYAPAEVYDSPLRQLLQDAGFPVIKGQIALPKKAGIGYSLEEKQVAKFRMD